MKFKLLCAIFILWGMGESGRWYPVVTFNSFSECNTVAMKYTTDDKAYTCFPFNFDPRDTK